MPRLLAFLLIPLLVGGCEATVDPGPGPDRPFTLYGYFDAGSDVQAVRVIPIAETLVPETREPIDARVVSTDLGTGAEVVWRDSVVTFASGAVGHVYTAPFRARFGSAYRLTVTRSDGLASVVETQMPPEATVEEQPARRDTTIRESGGMPADTTIRIDPSITFDIRGAIPRLLDVQAEYRVAVSAADEDGIVLSIPYGSSGDTDSSTSGLVQQTAEGWRITMRLEQDVVPLKTELLRLGLIDRRSEPIYFLDARLTMLAVGEEWVSPTGVFDSEALVEPGTFSNVQNGFGFVGAGYPITPALQAPDDVIEAAGFIIAPE